MTTPTSLLLPQQFNTYIIQMQFIEVAAVYNM